MTMSTVSPFSEQLSNSIMAELARTRRKSGDDGAISTRQLQQTCSRLLLEFESQIRSEYDRILSEKLSGLYVFSFIHSR